MPGTFDPVFEPTAPASCFDPRALAAAANKDVVAVRHPEWIEHQLRWRWLLDSLEGGERYRQAIYGFDWRGMPVRNMIRHKREYPEPGTLGAVGPYSSQPVGVDQAMPATDDDYELRRARTPVPTFVAETIDQYLGKIYSRKVRRDAPESPDYDGLRAWFADVDGRGTDVDSWMANTVGRLLLDLGCVDVLLVHPTPPSGETIFTHYDELRLNVFGCVARVVLPHNVVYWRLDSRGDYVLAVVQEWSGGGDADPHYQLGQITPTLPFAGSQSLYRPQCRYRVWLPDRWVLYDHAGVKQDEADHPFGRVPMVRLFCRRKPRAENVGQSLVESIAERQREYYNRDSELILSDVHQAHPIIQAPEDFIQPDVSIPMGPGYILPKKRNSQGASTTYEGWEVVDFPKGAAESIRLNKSDLRDDVDRDAGLTKPAGASGSGRSTVAQSGVSKEIDNDGLNARLCNVAKLLADAERRMADLVLTVVHDGRPPRRPVGADDPVTIQYPTQFHLSAPDKIATAATDFQAILAAAGEAPEAETSLLCELFRTALPGLEEEDYDRIDDEIGEAVEAASKRRSETLETSPVGLPVDPDETPTTEPDDDANHDDEPPEDDDGT